MGKVLVITGTPGTGKTSVANELEKFGLKKIPNEIIKKSIIGRDYELSTDIVDENLLIENVRKFLEKNDGIYVFDSHIAHVLPKDIVILYVLLRTDPNELKKRLEGRGWDDIKVMMNVMAENYNIIKNELDEMGVEYLEIDTTGKSPKEVAEIIIKKLRDKGLIK